MSIHSNVWRMPAWWRESCWGIWYRKLPSFISTIVEYSFEQEAFLWKVKKDIPCSLAKKRTSLVYIISVFHLPELCCSQKVVAPAFLWKRVVELHSFIRYIRYWTVSWTFCDFFILKTIFQQLSAFWPLEVTKT